MNITLYAPLNTEEANHWHKLLSQVAGVQMARNPEVDVDGRSHTFFTMIDEPSAIDPETDAE